MSRVIDYLLGEGLADRAIALVQHMPERQREEEFQSILWHGIKHCEEHALERVLEILGRPLSEAEKVNYCGARMYANDLTLLRKTKRVARTIVDEAMRVDFEKRANKSCLRYGFLEEAQALSQDEVAEWLGENLDSPQLHEEVAWVLKFFPFDFTSMIEKARAAAVSAGDLDRAIRIAKTTGGQGLDSRELLEILKARKAKVEKASTHDVQYLLYSMATFIELLPARNKMPTLWWTMRMLIRSGEAREARNLLSLLPERQQPRFAEAILEMQLSARGEVTFQDVWETEKYLGRKLTTAEARKRLEFSFPNKDIWLDFILRLPEGERAPFLEQLVEDCVRSHNLQTAQKAADLIPRALTQEELFEMLHRAYGSYDLWAQQRIPEPDMVQSSKKAIDAISQYIVSLPISKQVS